MPATSSWPPSHVKPCSARDKSSFAYESVAKRWPVILTDLINEVVRHLGDGERERQGKALINSVQELKYLIAHNRPIEPLSDDEHSNVDVYNAELERLTQEGSATWYRGPWLYEECYMYRRLHQILLAHSEWKSFDPFETSKTSGFQTSGKAVYALASSLQSLVAKNDHDEQLLHAIFLELIQAELWGNAAGDLSLFAGLSTADIEALQNSEGDRSHRIIDNDLAETWAHLSSLKDARIDIVLDNAGFELFTDLCFADWLVSCTPFCSRVVFSAKALPWFVSDVMPKDFAQILDHLRSPSFFTSYTPSEAESNALSSLVDRWQSLISNGTLSLAPVSPFWTGPSAFSALPTESPELLSELQKASLVIFKGDLNYRKLMGDLTWPHDTPFEQALGPLRGKIDLLTLRTCKADVVVGLAAGKAEELDREDPRWRWNGKYGIVGFSKRDA